MTPALVIDFGTYYLAAAFVAAHGAAPVIDPVSGEARWRCSLHWDGERVAVGALAEQRRRADPSGYATGIKDGLARQDPVLLGARRFHPFEQVVELLAAVRAEARRQQGRVSRAVLTTPAAFVAGDPRRDRLIAAAEAAGFTAVELLNEAVAAAWAPFPGTRTSPGDLLLVCDFGATFEASVVRIGDGAHEVIGHQSIGNPSALDLAAGDPPAVEPWPVPVERAIACCADLLARLGIDPRGVGAMLPIGGGVRTPGLALALERGVGIPTRMAAEPELAIVRGATRWLPRSGDRVVLGQPSAARVVPLAFPIRGGSATLLRWLVAPQDGYRDGAALARVRLADGAVWELTARADGVLDTVLVPERTPFGSGEWVALARH